MIVGIVSFAGDDASGTYTPVLSIVGIDNYYQFVFKILQIENHP